MRWHARTIGRCVILAALTVAIPPGDRVSAQDASGYMELSATHTDREAKDASGARTETTDETFLQRYGLDLSWRLYPNLSVTAGGLFERNATLFDEDLGVSDTTEQRIRPYLNVLLRTSISHAQFGYYKSEDEFKQGPFTTKDIQEVYSSNLGWRPEGLPRVDVRISRINNFDIDRRVKDTTDDVAELTGDYAPIGNLQIYYRGGVGRSEDRLEDTIIRRQSHMGRVSFAESWFDRRIQFGAQYDVDWRESEITTSGKGEIETPVLATAGLSLVTVTPTDGALANNTALIDQNRDASAGIDLGLPPIGGDDRPRNIGLDLGSQAEINRLLIWVDRELPPAIADSFSWDIYTSTDNVTWTLRQTVAPAASETEFGQPPAIPSRTRFELDFSIRDTRYIKAVTRPLAPTVPMAGSFPVILVTEMAAAISVPASEAERRLTRTTHRLSADVRTRILSRPGLYHELSYYARDEGGNVPFTYTLSNGLSLRHAFNPVYSVAARVAREDSLERDRERLEYRYSASLNVVPLDTLRHSLVFSGSQSDFEGASSETTSVYLNSTADLYRGVTVNLSAGKSFLEDETGTRTENTLVNALAAVKPHATTTLNIIYSSRESRQISGAGPEGLRRNTRSGQASASYRPMPSLYFYFSYRLEDELKARNRYLRNYSVSWAPFPGGNLQFQFRYDETYQSSLDSTSRIVSPRLRWNVTDRWYFDLGYERTRFDSNLSVATAESYTGTMRMWF